MEPKGIGRSEDIVYSGRTSESSSFIDESSPNRELGASEKPKEGLGKLMLRGLAGLTGGVALGTAFATGGALTLLAAVPYVMIAVPAGFIGSAIGAGLGTLNNPNKIDKTEVFLEGFTGGLSQHMVKSGEMIESVMKFPQAFIYNTAGRLGAGLLAFAKTGGKPEPYKTREKVQDYGYYEETVTEVKKTTVHKLLDRLQFVMQPITRGIESTGAYYKLPD